MSLNIIGNRAMINLNAQTLIHIYNNFAEFHDWHGFFDYIPRSFFGVFD